MLIYLKASLFTFRYQRAENSIISTQPVFRMIRILRKTAHAVKLMLTLWYTTSRLYVEKVK